MPTTAQMIARAEDLERRAQALRLAAAEMTDQAATTKVGLLPSALEQAIALRKHQRGSGQAGSNGHAAHNGASPAQAAPGAATGGEDARETLVRAALAEGPQTSRQLVEMLAQHGELMSQTWITQGLLRPMPDVRKIGSGMSTRWGLRTTRGARRPPAQEEREERERPTGKKKSYAKSYPLPVRERRAKTLAFLAQLAPATVFTPAELRAQGVSDDQLRLLAALTRYGYLKHKGDGYQRTAKVYTP